MKIGMHETSVRQASRSQAESSFVYIEQGAPRLVAAALAAARATTFVSKSTLHFEGESLVIGVRSALRRLSTNGGWTSAVLAVTRDEASIERLSRRASLARVLLARSADAGPGSLTFVASQGSSDELRQQLYALVQVLAEEFPRATVRIRFVPRGAGTAVDHVVIGANPSCLEQG